MLWHSDLEMRASTPDTVIIVGSDDEQEDEAREIATCFFINSVGRAPVGDQLQDLVRYIVKHPTVIATSNDNWVREMVEAQGRIIRLQGRLRDAQGDRVRLHGRVTEVLNELEEKKAVLAAMREKEDKRVKASVYADWKTLAMLRARVANKDAIIRRLERELAEKTIVNPRIEELGDELLRKNALLQKWRNYAKEKEKEVPAKVDQAAGRDEEDAADGRPGSADSGRGSAEPVAGPSSGRSATRGLAPHTVRSMLVAQQDSESEDEITVLAQRRPRHAAEPETRRFVVHRCRCGARFETEEVKKEKE